MRWFFVLEHLGGQGGVESVLTTVSTYLRDKGHEVVLLMPHPSDNPAWEVPLCTVYYAMSAPPPRSALDHVATRILGLCHTASLLPQPDVVVATHVPHTALYARMAFGHLRGVPVVSWLHAPLQLFAEPHLVQYADLHWCISSGIASSIAELVGGAANVHWIGNPVRIDVSRVPAPKGKPRFLYMGRLENGQKRLDVLLHGLSQLDEDWHLDVYGDGPDRGVVKDWAESLGIDGRITWHGYVPSPWERVSEASALLLTSDIEGFGMVLAEALARGVPAVAADCPTGPRDLVEDGANGYLFRSGDSLDLRRKLSLLLSRSDAERERMAEIAVQSVQKFSVDRVVGRMLASLSACLKVGR
ncbi:glycosyltransferase [Alicyclobacillus acidocaldarius]|uniref:glycosyltransferase n=1 Tax=Alicyclobacillus acidocaldarius TaxID=405212 RepID=UPI00345EF655